MTERKATAGNLTEKDRADCEVSIILTTSGGLKIDLESKVKSLYGVSIVELCNEVLDFFGIKHAQLEVRDRGALPFVICARLEAAIKKLIETEKEFLTEVLAENLYKTDFDRLRVSRLYVPGNKPSLMINAAIHAPHGIIFDLEDAVSPERKLEARILVRNALRSVDLIGAERMVRINQIPMGLEDLGYIVPSNVNLILVPKCQGADQIWEINERIRQIQDNENSHPVWLLPIIESAMGVMKVLEIAQSAANVVGLAIGLEDYTADIGVNRTREATESFFARSSIVNACAAVGIQPLDSVFSDVADMEGLAFNTKQSKAIGFRGMGVIHPRQIKVIHEYFRPDEQEVLWAQQVVDAFDEATLNGLGVISIGTKMIDMPVVQKARETLKMAKVLDKKEYL